MRPPRVLENVDFGVEITAALQHVVTIGVAHAHHRRRYHHHHHHHHHLHHHHHHHHLNKIVFLTHNEAVAQIFLLHALHLKPVRYRQI